MAPDKPYLPPLYFPTRVASSARVILEQQVCIIGRGGHATVTLDDPMVSWMHAMVWQEDGQVWLMDLHATDGTFVDRVRVEGSISLRRDAVIQIGDSSIRLQLFGSGDSAGDRSDSSENELPGMPYTVTVWYGQDVPDQVMFLMPDGSNKISLAAERRVALIYVLASKLSADRRAGRLPDEQGWCIDDDVGIGVWGRHWWGQRPGRLNVLVHRVRRALEASGIDPECLEKTNGRLRLWVWRVDIATPTVTGNVDSVETVFPSGRDELSLELS
jgi:hypothetical protein